jgi:hypothetical protein
MLNPLADSGVGAGGVAENRASNSRCINWHLEYSAQAVWSIRYAVALPGNCSVSLPEPNRRSPSGAT